MAIKFKHGGREWEADTPAEAIALRDQLEGRDQEAMENGEDLDWLTEPVWTPDRIQELRAGLGTQQKMFLLLLFENPEITSLELKDKMRLGSESVLAGIVSGLSKQLRKLKFRPEHLYSVTIRWTGKDKIRTFRLSNNFRWVAESQMGWPEALPAEEAQLRTRLLTPPLKKLTPSSSRISK